MNNKIYGLTVHNKIPVFDPEKNEPLVMTTVELLLNHMAGTVDYQVVTYVNGKFQYTELGDIYLSDRGVAITRWEQSQSGIQITWSNIFDGYVLKSDGSCEPIRTILPTDELVTYAGNPELPAVAMANWVAIRANEYSNQYELVLKNATNLVVDSLVVGRFNS